MAWLPETFFKAVKLRRGRYWSRYVRTEFVVGGTYVLPGSRRPRVGVRGYHACRSLPACFLPLYGYTVANPVLEVRMGSVDGCPVAEGCLKTCAVAMQVLRVVPEEEVRHAVAGVYAIQGLYFMNGTPYVASAPRLDWTLDAYEDGSEVWTSYGARGRTVVTRPGDATPTP